MSPITMKRLAFLLLATACALPQVGTAAALLAGIAFSLAFANPWPAESSAWSRKLLQISVVGLGFGLSLPEIWQVGKSSIGYTIIGILLTILIGSLLGRVLGVRNNTSLLVSFGTAICGGSAIAAMAPVLKAESEDTAVSLATVFMLNSVALLAFPPVGSFFGISQHAFGLWAGLAIHDTSSVVGAAAAYGPAALATATTVKLARALWITPCVMVAAVMKKTSQKGVVPLFIIGFLVAATIRSLVPSLNAIWGDLAAIARQLLVVTLFLIGSGLSRGVLRKVGLRPLLQGCALWLLVSSVTLLAVIRGWIA
ncbi:putative sulfate exporter family transporter [Geobacter pelophilus]|uniref:Sulfate exporter family transporter n=1 Tax=Geoanaerobacter pelophilus TaxID=60036 RepID=A0AAW4KYK3_9BACT|nr:putative sulfate exporter family transporter [Geoanaerobacter pelophilus]